MNARLKSFLSVAGIAFSHILCGLFVYGPRASGQPSPHARGASENGLHIELQDAQGTRIAIPDVHTPIPSSVAPTSAVLAFDRQYQPGDRIVFGGGQRVALRLDKSMPECLLYFPDYSQGNAAYEIPYGRAEQETGSAYDPESFAGKPHQVAVRFLNGQELTGYRNLALNPCDQALIVEVPPQVFPHASSNSFSRNLFDFHARNAIDGVFQNGHHGVWPYQSWGPGLRTDVWWKVEFGRSVELDKIRLMVRADFPHDSYWKSAEVEFSDGSRLPLQISQSAEFQEFPFPKRRASWLRIANVVPADSTRWCSLIEVEAWGRDLP